MGTHLSMKHILQRGKHLWKAKGRHGTHSPFVYAFVEQVLRSKKRFQVKNSPLSQKQINQINRSIQYLGADVIYADAFLFETINALSNHASSAKFKVLPLDISKEDYKDGACFVCFSGKASNDFLINIVKQSTCAAIIPLNQKNKNQKQYWEHLKNEPIFKMALDTWYIGFISNHPDFKIKQYFRLR
ncbi:hypothetical protein F0919_02200 [Taibaiella lutea]|uniref:Uncharacterized protein n=1 Tax=Taibaiella lutea TaxID=2608001 RepID=A0A5M6CMR1_9BACT|nr:hypothetical protein [Taibaiella lutea]KAA5536501.1 hypothetical protein F0919_02200 [Taibaiella lutea]